MSLSEKELINWNDIISLYEALNTAQEQHHITQTEIPNEQNNIISINHATDLIDAISTLSQSGYISESDVIVNEEIPSIDDLITPKIFNECASTIEKLNAICYFDASFRASHRSSYDSGYNAGFRSSHRSSYDSGYNASHRSSHNSSHDSSHNPSFKMTAFSTLEGFTSEGLPYFRVCPSYYMGFFGCFFMEGFFTCTGYR